MLGGTMRQSETLNYFGFNRDTQIWSVFSHSSYWSLYNYDMNAMACIINDEILYTFGGAAGGNLANVADNNGNGRDGNNIISYHNISDYNAPFLVNDYSLWNRIPQDIPQPGGYWRVVSVGDLIYIISGWDYTSLPNGACCIRSFTDVQILDTKTRIITGKNDGVVDLPIILRDSACHFHPTRYSINCFGGIDDQGTINGAVYSDKWLYSNALLTKAPTISPTSNTKLPTDTPTQTPSNLPTINPTVTPTDSPTNTPTNTPTQTPTKSPTNIPTNTPTINTTENPTTAPTISMKINSANNNSHLNHNIPYLMYIMISIPVFCILCLCIILMCLIFKKTNEKLKEIKEQNTNSSSNSNTINIRIKSETIPSYSPVSHFENETTKSDNIIAVELQKNQYDIHRLTSGNINENEFNTKGSQNHNESTSYPHIYPYIYLINDIY